MKAAREGKHGDEHTDGAGDPENGHDGGNPAGTNAAQVVNDGDGHSSNPPECVNHAQAHRRGGRKYTGENPHGYRNSNSHDYRWTRQTEVGQETVSRITAHGEEFRQPYSDAAADDGNQKRLAQNEEQNETVGVTDGFKDRQLSNPLAHGDGHGIAGDEKQSEKHDAPNAENQ